MHAASVHPEPGSNSRMFVSKISQRRSQISIRAWLLFTFCLSSISLRIVEFRSHTIHESLHVQCLYFPLVVQFSMTDFRPRSLRSLIIISQPDPFVKGFFKLFWNFFKLFFQPLLNSRSRRDSPIILHHSPFVNRFLKNSLKNFQKTFFKIFWLFFKNLLTNQNICDIIHKLTARWSSG